MLGVLSGSQSGLFLPWNFIGYGYSIQIIKISCNRPVYLQVNFQFPHNCWQLHTFPCHIEWPLCCHHLRWRDLGRHRKATGWENIWMWGSFQITKFRLGFLKRLFVLLPLHWPSGRAIKSANWLRLKVMFSSPLLVYQFTVVQGLSAKSALNIYWKPFFPFSSSQIDLLQQIFSSRAVLLVKRLFWIKKLYTCVVLLSSRLYLKTTTTKCFFFPLTLIHPVIVCSSDGDFGLAGFHSGRISTVAEWIKRSCLCWMGKPLTAFPPMHCSAVLLFGEESQNILISCSHSSMH